MTKMAMIGRRDEKIAVRSTIEGRSRIWRFWLSKKIVFVEMFKPD